MKRPIDLPSVLLSGGLVDIGLGTAISHPLTTAIGAALAALGAGTCKEIHRALAGPDAATRLKQAEKISLEMEHEAGLVFDLVGSPQFADPERDRVFKLWPGYWEWHLIADSGQTSGDLLGPEYWAVHMQGNNTAFWADPEKLCYLEAMEKIEEPQKKFEETQERRVLEEKAKRKQEQKLLQETREANKLLLEQSKTRVAKARAKRVHEKNSPTPKAPPTGTPVWRSNACIKCGAYTFRPYGENHLACTECGLIRQVDYGYGASTVVLPSATPGWPECPESPSGFHLYTDEPRCRYCGGDDPIVYGP